MNCFLLLDQLLRDLEIFRKLCDSLREIKNAISLQASEKIDVETKKLIDKKVVIDYSSPNIANAIMSAIFAR